MSDLLIIILSVAGALISCALVFFMLDCVLGPAMPTAEYEIPSVGVRLCQRRRRGRWTGIVFSGDLYVEKVEDHE